MDLIQEYKERHQFFREITGFAMKVHAKYKSVLMESAYEAALKYLLEQHSYKVEQQVYLPMYWDDVKLDQSYRMDLVVNDSIIIELKAVSHVETIHRKQLMSYMNLTHMPYGILFNFGSSHLYSEWYERDSSTGEITKIN